MSSCALSSRAVDDDEHADREERFKHLLQPIRDLAQNWDVDIASSLEDYLEDLEDITITLDGGASKVNFAEAALLIQGSACVYSRKVEHVYHLVLRTIEFLTQQKIDNSTKNSDKSGGEDRDDMAAGEDMTFLPLDDMLEEGKNIDLQIDNEHTSAPGRYGRNGGARRSSAAGAAAVSFGQDAYGYQGGSGNDGDGAWREVSWGGKGLSEINRPAMFLMEQDYGNSFKMSTCAVDQSGALLIDGAPLSSTTTSNRGRTTHSAAGGQNSFSSDFWGGLLREGETRGLVQRDAALWGDPWGAGGGGGNGDDDSDDDGGGDFAGGYGGFGGGDEDDDGGVEESKGGETEPQSFLGPHTPIAGREMRQWQRQEEQQQRQARTEAESRKRADPWAALDPHDQGNVKAKPLRRGRAYRLPPQLQLKKRRAKDKDKDNVHWLGEVVDEEAMSGETWVGHDGKLIPFVPLHGLAYPEFRYVERREKQRKVRQARLARVQAREFFMGRHDFLADASTSSASPILVLASQHAGTNEGEQDPLLDGYESGGGYSSDGGGVGGGFEGGGGYGDFGGGLSDDDDDYGGGGRGEGGGEAAVAPICLEDAFRDKPPTYEDLCRSHIEAFMRGTERYAHETQLSRRVGAWQNKLEPLMRSQEKRQAFDIHLYGRSVLSSVASVLTPAQRARAQAAKKGASSKAAKASADATRDEDTEDMPAVDFGVVVSGKPQFEVCRLFLASLQLANNGNVRLFHGECAAEQESTPFRLELLSFQDADNMTGYFAPSAAAGIGIGLENVP